MTSIVAGEESLSADELGVVRFELLRLYRELDHAVARAGPTCQLSGRCCRFKEFGHTLFVSAPEALLLVADGPRPVGPLDDPNTCPWQTAQGQCTARDARPLSCRVYFCDPSYQSQAQELSESFLGRLKQVVQERAWPWSYAPLHHHLALARDHGHLKIDLANTL
jgi:hypothetical protein